MLNFQKIKKRKIYLKQNLFGKSGKKQELKNEEQVKTILKDIESEQSPTDRRMAADRGAIAAHIKNALLVAAYLSSAKPDIVENPEQAKIYRPTRNALRYASIRKWDVGIRYMQSRNAAGAEAASPGSQVCAARQRPRAHMRKAHWHTYWVGKGRKERRILWLPPVAVGMNGMLDGTEVSLTSDDLPIVVRGAESEAYQRNT